MKKIAVIFGTRPEIIKLAPIIKESSDIITLYTGQHYSKELSEDIFNDLDLKKPRFNLEVVENSHATQVAKMMIEIEKILIQEKIEWVIVQGDTNSTLAGAMVASKLGIKLLHIEAGARSFNRSEPEEINRVMTDHLANINIAFNSESLKNLKNEGIRKNIHNIPNTAYQVCLHQIKKIKPAKVDPYILVTIHRATNTNDPKRMKNIVGLLNQLSSNNKIIFPMHPRTKKLLSEYGLSLNQLIQIVPPASYNKFLEYIYHSNGVISDSGGVVDECALMQKRLIILRNETERMDIVKNGTAKLVSPDLKNKLQVNIINKFFMTKHKPKKPYSLREINSIAKNILKTIKTF
jgi:UDP-GlcNAc3NAcA epimerase